MAGSLVGLVRVYRWRDGYYMTDRGVDSTWQRCPLAFQVQTQSTRL